MSPAVRMLLDEALALSEYDRVALADGIWHSLGEDTAAELPTSDGSEDEQDEADHRLLLERLAEADAHPKWLIDGDQAMREIRECARSKKRP